jgi:hypothetical protein
MQSQNHSDILFFREVQFIIAWILHKTHLQAKIIVFKTKTSHQTVGSGGGDIPPNTFRARWRSSVAGHGGPRRLKAAGQGNGGGTRKGVPNRRRVTRSATSLDRYRPDWLRESVCKVRAATNEVFPRGCVTGARAELGGNGRWGDLGHEQEVLGRQLTCALFWCAQNYLTRAG